VRAVVAVIVLEPLLAVVKRVSETEAGGAAGININLKGVSPTDRKACYVSFKYNAAERAVVFEVDCLVCASRAFIAVTVAFIAVALAAITTLARVLAAIDTFVAGLFTYTRKLIAVLAVFVGAGGHRVFAAAGSKRKYHAHS
jgi:prophage DNA circulation protein